MNQPPPQFGDPSDGNSVNFPYFSDTNSQNPNFSNGYFQNPNFQNPTSQNSSSRKNLRKSNLTWEPNAPSTLPKTKTKFTMDEIDAAVAKAHTELCSAGENVSAWKVSEAAVALLEVDSWANLQTNFRSVPSLKKLLETEAKVSTFIHCFVAARRIVSLYDLEVALCKNEDLERFEEIGLGPLYRHPLAKHYFSVPSDVTEIFKISSEEIIFCLYTYGKSVKWSTNAEDFLGFLAKQKSVASKENLGVRIQSLGLHLSLLEEVKKAETALLYKTVEKLEHGYDTSKGKENICSSEHNSSMIKNEAGEKVLSSGNQVTDDFGKSPGKKRKRKQKERYENAISTCELTNRSKRSKSSLTGNLVESFSEIDPSSFCKSQKKEKVVEVEKGDQKKHLRNDSSSELEIRRHDIPLANGRQGSGLSCEVKDFDGCSALKSSVSEDILLQEANSIVESIRREEFGLDKDLSSSENHMLNKQHARLGRALHYLSQELYSHDSHFLLELVQNADDNMYPTNEDPTLAFVLQDNGITVLNNEQGFSAQNIKALCDIGTSTKKGSTGYIGHKGIGFKSVFRITDAPEIHSNGFHLKFDITEAQIGVVLPTLISPCNIDSYRQLLSDNNNKKYDTKWNTCIVLPFRSNVKDGPGMASIISMFSDLHPSWLLFLHRLQCIKLVNMLNNTCVIMRREILANGIVKVSHGKYTMSWLMISKNLQANLLRPDVQTTKISIAFTLEECENGEYKPQLTQQPVFAFLPIQEYGLKFIIQGDFVLPSSREEVDGDSAWNQWLLSTIPSLFVRARKSFYLLPGFMKNPGKAVTAFMSFVPLVGEVHGFFSHLPNMIISELRTSKCMVLDCPDLAWDLPCKVLRGWNAQVRKLLPDSLLREHTGLGYLSKDIELSDALAKALGIQEYGPKVLLNVIASVCHTGDGIKSLGLGWLSSWIATFQSALSTCSSAYLSSAGVEHELCNDLSKVPFIPLSDGSYSSLSDGPIWLPLHSLGIGMDCKSSANDFPNLRTVSPLLFTAEATPTSNISESRRDCIVQMLCKVGVQKLSGHEVIKNDKLAAFSVQKLPPFDSYIQILRQLSAVALPSLAAHEVFQVLVKLADGINCGVITPKEILDLKENLSKLENTVLPTLHDKWVSLHPSFGLVCWSDDDALKNQYKHSDDINILYFGELSQEEQDMLSGKIAPLMLHIGLPAISEVSREAITYGAEDSKEKVSLINQKLPYAQRYLYKLYPDTYTNFKELGLQKLRQLQVLVVDKLLYKHTLKGRESTSNTECSCLLQGNTLYVTSTADSHSIFLELSRLFFSGSTNLQFANFLQTITTMAESGLSYDQIEFFLVNSQQVPKLPIEDSIWCLSFPSGQDIESQLPATAPVIPEQNIPPEIHRSKDRKALRADRKRLRYNKLAQPNVSESNNPTNTDTGTSIDVPGSLNVGNARIKEETSPSETTTVLQDLLPVAVPEKDLYEHVEWDPPKETVDDNRPRTVRNKRLNRRLANRSPIQVQRELTGSSGESIPVLQDLPPVAVPEKKLDEHVELDPPKQTVSARTLRNRRLTSIPIEVRKEFIGRSGEAIAYQYFVDMLGPENVKWINEETETGLPYDLVIGNSESTMEYIEVKSTKIAKKKWFSLSAREWKFALEKGEAFSIAHVVCKDNGAITVVKNPWRLCKEKKIRLVLLMQDFKETKHQYDEFDEFDES